jgi:cytochrome P450
VFFERYDAAMTGLWTDPELRRLGRVALLEFLEYLASLLARPRERPGRDLISRLVVAEIAGERLSSDELGSFESLLRAAGGDSTLRSATSGVKPLRRSTDTLPAGAVMRLATASANLDERVFTDPNRFWPDRPDLRLGKELRSGATVDGR